MKGAKSTSKKERETAAIKSKPIVSDSENTDGNDTVILDYGNGLELDLHGNNDSISSDGGWNSNDDRMLVRKIKDFSKTNDKISFKARLKHVDWGEIAFKHYSPKDCEDRFNMHMKQVRLFRTLNEIAVDIETKINKCPLKRPLNSYQLFIQEQLLDVKYSGDFADIMKNLAKRYKELPAEEKFVYQQKAELLMQEYQAKKKDFASSNDLNNISGIVTAAEEQSTVAKAKTPFMLYVDSQQSGREYRVLRTEYAHLSNDQKYEWIAKALELAPESGAEILNREEQRILKGQSQKLPNAYNLFVKENYDKMKLEINSSKHTDVFSKLAKLWKTMGANKKKIYTEKAKALAQEVTKQQNEFNERHGIVPQKVQRRKSVYIEQLIEMHSDEENDEKDNEVDKAVDNRDENKEKSPLLTPIKRKHSNSNGNEFSDDEPPTKKITTRRKPQIKMPFKPLAKKQPKKPDHTASNIVNDDVTDGNDTIKKEPENLNSPSESGDVNDRSECEEATSSTRTASKKKSRNEKTHKTVESLSESTSDVNDRDEHEIASCSTVTSPKKKSKKEKKEKNIEPPGAKPPSTFFDYFAKHIHTGKPRKAQKTFDKLTKDERKQYTIEYNELLETYVTHLKKYLGTLSKVEAEAYIKKIRETDGSTDETEKMKKSDEDEGSQAY